MKKVTETFKNPTILISTKNTRASTTDLKLTI